ncbi:hypothetical protein HYDPIDRAFT_28223 [Hydnomerulius pinastri MD-312]|uniref:Xylanolytic transcriptional activator regulatory domain-containing protein n=1 Tax=Hydnomerulius pinastri MD-312 TaxID=994086 RepID=A0A0C9VGY6_9AGAM|nr:hypothetical protein HYDPIDRAFT_28223 [Hydnomerulius pinastri MD-312]
MRSQEQEVQGYHVKEALPEEVLLQARLFNEEKRASLAGAERWQVTSVTPELSRSLTPCSCVRDVMEPGRRAHNGNRRPRTLALEEDIARLQARVQELENPHNTTPSIELYSPYAPMSPPNRAIGQASYQALRIPATSASSSTSSLATTSSGSSWGFDGPSQHSVQQSVAVLTPHAAEIGFFLRIDRLRAQSAHIIPALRSTLALWSVHLQSKVSEQALLAEPTLLSRAQHQLSDALSAVNSITNPQSLMHIIQTEVLISFYLQRTGQALGARYHASAALSLALGLRLHIGSGEAPSASLFDFLGSFQHQLPPPTDSIEEKERVDAFWTVYSLDRCLGAIHNGPPATSNAITITVPWPSTDWATEGQNDFMQPSASAAPVNTVLQFLNGQENSSQIDSALGLQAKASALLSEAASVAVSFTTHNLIQRFCASLPHSSSISIPPGTLQPNSRQAILTIALAALAQITLHRPLAPTHEPSNNRCVEAALLAVSALDGLSDPGFMNPLCAAIWTALCFVLHDEILRLRAQRSQPATNADTSWASSSRAPSRQAAHHEEEARILQALRKLLAVLGEMSARCPMMSFAAKFEALLPILESIST